MPKPRDKVLGRKNNPTQASRASLEPGTPSLCPKVDAWWLAKAPFDFHILRNIRYTFFLPRLIQSELLLWGVE